MADEEDIASHVVRAGDSDHAAIAGLVEMLRQAGAPAVASAADPLHAYSLLMTAAATYAGTIFGQMIVMGVATEQQKRRATDTVTRNFRSGIDVGKAATTRILRETTSGRA